MDAAIVGAGAAGLLHAWALRTRHVRIAHVFDPDRARAANFAAVFGARVHASLDSLADAGADCVCICSPPVAHVDQATRVAERASLVLVEKPVGVSRAELARLVDVPRCVPIVQWRAGRSLQALRRATAAGLFGEAPSVTIDMTLHRDAAYFAGGRRDRGSWGCGALLSVGIHALDALVYIFGKAVAASWSAFDRDGDGEGEGASAVERSAVVALAFAGGGLATLRITFDAGGPDATRITAAGRGVTAVIAGSESDPTCAPIEWSAREPSLRARLESMEARSAGHLGAPLLVPYIGEAIDAFRAGFAPGQHDALPTIATVAVAHRIALDAYEARAAV